MRERARKRGGRESERSREKKSRRVAAKSEIWKEREKEIEREGGRV